MRQISILLSLVGSLSAFAQIEIIHPPAIGDDLTATWTVVVSNPGLLPAAPRELRVDFGPFPPLEGAVVGLPAGCRAVSARHIVCEPIVLGPRERRELQFRLRFNGRYGEVHVYTTFGGGETRAFGRNVFPRLFPVTSTADSGPGSLRQAILDINQACTAVPEPCAPAFQLDGPVPVEGWFTIRPLSPLPPVTAAYAIVDGRSQTLHTGDTNSAGPEVMLDGSSAAWGHGLQFDGARLAVTDLAIGNFPETASPARRRARP
jgi:hypothetical protein